MIFQICVTEKCNMNCEYCYMQNRDVFMSKECFDRAYSNMLKNRELFNIDNMEISYFGGEPLLNMDLILYIHEKLRNEVKSEVIITNGTIIPSELQDLLNEGVGISLSFDGLWQHEYHDTVISNYKTFYKNYTTSCKAMITPSHLKKKSLLENALYLIDTGFKSIDFSIVRDPIWQSDDIKLFEEQLKELAVWYVNNFNELDDISINPFFLYIADSILGKRNFACFAGHGGFALMPDGCLYPCARFGTNRKYMIMDEEGNVDLDLIRIFKYCNNPKHYVGCEKCFIYNYCNGGCMYSQIEYFDALVPIKEVCDIFRITTSVSHWVLDKLYNNEKFKKLMRRTYNVKM